MQTDTLAINESAASANSVTPDTTSTQQSSASPPGIDPDLLKTIDELSAEIRKCAAHALGWKIMMGVKLREYQDGMDVQDWNLLLESGRLPFSGRTVQTLTRIGGHKILADMKRTPQLPDSITVLNELAGLPLPVVEQALTNGTIHPGTTLAEARNLVAQHRAKKAARLNLPLTIRLI